MQIIFIGCLLMILMIAWSISNVFKEGFASCTTLTTDVIPDFNKYTLGCQPNQYLSQLKRQQDGADKKYSYKCCTDSSGNMQGPAGDKGEPGEPGKPAKNGERGPQGEKGQPGPQGEQGLIGPRGKAGREIGDTGKDGEPGYAGLQGPPGPNGMIESTGPAEPPIVGPKGKTGPQGPKGKVGLPGENAPEALKQSQKKGGKDKLEKVQLYLLKALSKQRPPAPKSKLTIHEVDDDESVIINAPSTVDNVNDIYYDAEIVEDFTPSCAQGKEYNVNTFKQS